MGFGSFLCRWLVGESDDIDWRLVFGRFVIVEDEEFVSTVDFGTGFVCLQRLIDPYLSQAQTYFELESESLSPSLYFVAPYPMVFEPLSSVHSLKESIPLPQTAFSIASYYLIQTQLWLILSVFLHSRCSWCYRPNFLHSIRSLSCWQKIFSTKLRRKRSLFEKMGFWPSCTRLMTPCLLLDSWTLGICSFWILEPFPSFCTR